MGGGGERSGGGGERGGERGEGREREGRGEEGREGTSDSSKQKHVAEVKWN